MAQNEVIECSNPECPDAGRCGGQCVKDWNTGRFLLSIRYMSGATVDFVGGKKNLLQDISERIELNVNERNVMSWTISPLY